VRQVHAEDRVPGLHRREIDGHVRLRSGVGLDVDVIAAEELLAAFDRQGLGDVDELAAAVIALARIALRILVGHDAALGLQDGLAHEVLRGDELQAAGLPGGFFLNGIVQFPIRLLQDRHEVTSFSAD